MHTGDTPNVSAVSAPFGWNLELLADRHPDTLGVDAGRQRLVSGTSTQSAQHVVGGERGGSQLPELFGHQPPEHRDTHVSTVEGVNLAQLDVPSWGPTALTIAGILVAGTSLIALLAYFRKR